MNSENGNPQTEVPRGFYRNYSSADDKKIEDEKNQNILKLIKDLDISLSKKLEEVKISINDNLSKNMKIESQRNKIFTQESIHKNNSDIINFVANLLTTFIQINSGKVSLKPLTEDKISEISLRHLSTKYNKSSDQRFTGSTNQNAKRDRTSDISGNSIKRMQKDLKDMTGETQNEHHNE